MEAPKGFLGGKRFTKVLHSTLWLWGESGGNRKWEKRKMLVLGARGGWVSKKKDSHKKHILKKETPQKRKKGSPS